MFSDFNPRLLVCVGVAHALAGGVQEAWNTDAVVFSPFHERSALFNRFRNEQALNGGDGVGDDLNIPMAEDVACGDIDEVRIDSLYLVNVGLDVLHLGEIFDRPFFASGDD